MWRKEESGSLGEKTWRGCRKEANKSDLWAFARQRAKKNLLLTSCFYTGDGKITPNDTRKNTRRPITGGGKTG